MSVIVSAGLPTGMEGLTYPIPFSEPEAVIRIAQHAERLGYHSVWGNDHMTTQHYVRAEFPVPPRFWEPLITYAFVAAHTKTLRLGTGVLVLPMRRDIVVLAKQLATLDHFSGGRLEFGVGVGAYREEFEALWPDSKAHRGDMVEEGVKAIQALFGHAEQLFRGKILSVSRCGALSEAAAEASADLLRRKQREAHPPCRRIRGRLDSGGHGTRATERNG